MLTTSVAYTQLRGDTDLCPIGGVTNSGRDWRKVPESDEHTECANKSVDVVLRSIAAVFSGLIFQDGRQTQLFKKLKTPNLFHAD